MKELVSVIIPAHNCESTIETAIRSILDQTYPNLEVIVVDDNSIDKTGDVARKMADEDKRIRVYTAPENADPRFDKKLSRNINAGYSARNIGLKHVKGSYITFQDADDASLLNRIEIQVDLLEKHNAMHVTTDWIRFEEKHIGKKLNLVDFFKLQSFVTIGPEELYRLAQKTRGIAMSILGPLHRYIPFSIKRMRVINRLFFGSVTSYPGVTGIPLFKREVIESICFRPLPERVWPSFMGRGVDRDFSFRVAEKYRNSYVFFIPLYMWRVKNGNPRYPDSIDSCIL